TPPSNVQTQTIPEPGGQVRPPPKTNHDCAYQYNGAGPHQATKIGATALTFDPNGNTLTETRLMGPAPKNRRYDWDEENWLTDVVDDGNVTSFLYDGSGERVGKRGKFGETAYLGQFYSVQDGTQATKHIFAGSTRIASKLDKAPKDPPPGGTTPGNGKPGHLVGIARACEMGLGEKVGLLP